VTNKRVDEPLGERHRTIHAAAIEQFTLRGIAGTSMANIAEAAGMSRPALYQYFRNKADIYASAFVALFEEQVELALAALAPPGTTAERLDGFLQRFEGDLWQLLAASPHADEILRAKNAQVAASIADVVDRLWTQAAEHVAEMAPGRSRAMIERRTGWIEVLRFSPKGLTLDRPAIEVYRRRLRTLAHSVAADIEST
jgi:AcrR family transcriptional regulator